MKNKLSSNFTFNLKKRTHLMGIVNITTDSFVGDGLIVNKELARETMLQKVHHYINAKVDIIDIGGESTRPDSLPISEEEELTRVIPVIQAIRQHYSVPISIDTTKAKVAEQSFLAGANILNDVSGLTMDPHIAEVAARFDVPVVLMHMKLSHSGNTEPQDIINEVLKDLESLATHAIDQGIRKENIILDPGIGYGKNAAQNLSILKNLQCLKALGYPLLVGVSRKAFIGYTTQAPVDQRLFGSIAANSIAVLQGADIIRVHDVAETFQAVQIADAIRRA